MTNEEALNQIAQERAKIKQSIKSANKKYKGLLSNVAYDEFFSKIGYMNREVMYWKLKYFNSINTITEKDYEILIKEI